MVVEPQFHGKQSLTSPAVGAASTIGRPVRRREDARILSGRSRFLDDIELPGTLHMAFVRSPHAHARVLEVRGRALDGGGDRRPRACRPTSPDRRG